MAMGIPEVAGAVKKILSGQLTARTAVFDALLDAMLR
jgi:hypothetical protein